MSIERLLKRFQDAKQVKATFDIQLKEAYKYCLPQIETINDRAEGSNKQMEVFDDTAKLALQKYANRLAAQLIPFGKQWALLEAGVNIKENNEEINRQLEEITKIVFNNLPHSNFHSAVHEAFQDLAISTGVLICEAGDGIYSHLRFRSVPIKELVLESSTKGLINTVWREFKCEVKDIDYLYPEAKLTDDLKRLAEEKPEQKVDLIEGVIYDERKHDYHHCVIYKKHYLITRRIQSSPYIIFREKKAPNETYGRGRALDCLPTIKTLNKLAEDHLYATSLNAKGVYTIADDGIINPYTIKLEAGALIPVDSNNTSAPTIRPLEIATNFQINIDTIQRLQAIINETFLAQPFGSIEETPIRTATEMSIRQNDLTQTTMATFSRLQSEFLEPLIQRMLFVLAEAGVLPPLRADGKDVAIKFTSPVSRMQDLEDLQNIQQFMLYAQALPQELIMGTVKVEEIPAYIADRLGLPKSLIRTKAEQDAAKQAAAMSEIQQTQALAQAQTIPQGVK